MTTPTVREVPNALHERRTRHDDEQAAAGRRASDPPAAANPGRDAHYAAPVAANPHGCTFPGRREHGWYCPVHGNH